jgi:ADP-ribose pyrophosphatase
MTDESHNPWTTLSSRQVYENPWIRVDEHQVLNPSGKPGIYGVVHFKSIATGVVPIDEEGCTYLVGQYRYTLQRYSWEMPEGGGHPEVDPLLSAQRELEEETGLHARHWRELGRAHLSNSVSDELAVMFLAWGLTPGPSQPEETEQLQVKRLPFREAYRLVEEGLITDSMTVIAFLRLRLLALEGKLPQELAAALSG